MLNNKFIIVLLIFLFSISKSFAIDVIPHNKKELNKYISTDNFHYHYSKYKETNKYLEDFFVNMGQDEILEALTSISNKTSNLAFNKLANRILFSNSKLHINYLDELLKIRLQNIFKYKNYEELNLVLKFVDKDIYKAQITEILIANSKIPQLCSIYKDALNNENLFSTVVEYFNIKLICTVFNKNTSYAIELTKSFQNMDDVQKENYYNAINGVVTENNKNLIYLVIMNLLGHDINNFINNIENLSSGSLLFMSTLSRKVSFEKIIKIANILYIKKVFNADDLQKKYLIASYKLDPKISTNKPFIMYVNGKNKPLTIDEYITNIQQLTTPQDKIIYAALHKEKLANIKPIKTSHAKFIVQTLAYFKIDYTRWIKLNDLWFYKTISSKKINDYKNFTNWIENIILKDSLEKDFYKIAFLIQMGYKFNEKLHISKAKIRKHKDYETKIKEKSSKFQGPNSIEIRSENFSKQFNKDKFIIKKISSLINDKIINYDEDILAKKINEIHKNIYTNENHIVSIPDENLIKATGLLIATKNNFLAENILIANDFIKTIEDKSIYQNKVSKTERENQIND